MSIDDLIGAKRMYDGDHGTFEVKILDYRGLGFWTVQACGKGSRGRASFGAQSYELGLQSA